MLGNTAMNNNVECFSRAHNSSVTSFPSNGKRNIKKLPALKKLELKSENLEPWERYEWTNLVKAQDLDKTIITSLQKCYDASRGSNKKSTKKSVFNNKELLTQEWINMSNTVIKDCNIWNVKDYMNFAHHSDHFKFGDQRQVLNQKPKDVIKSFPKRRLSFLSVPLQKYKQHVELMNDFEKAELIRTIKELTPKDKIDPHILKEQRIQEEMHYLSSITTLSNAMSQNVTQYPSGMMEYKNKNRTNTLPEIVESNRDSDIGNIDSIAENLNTIQQDISIKVQETESAIQDEPVSDIVLSLLQDVIRNVFNSSKDETQDDYSEITISQSSNINTWEEDYNVCLSKYLQILFGTKEIITRERSVQLKEQLYAYSSETTKEEHGLIDDISSSNFLFDQSQVTILEQPATHPAEILPNDTNYVSMLDEIWIPKVNAYYAYTEDADPAYRLVQFMHTALELLQQKYETQEPKYKMEALEIIKEIRSPISRQYLDLQAEDPYDEHLSELKYLRSKPLCCIIFGKPGLESKQLAEKIAHYWKCIYINVYEELKKELVAESNVAALLKDLLESGNVAPGGLVFRVILQRMLQPLVCHRGYILDGFPFHPKENDLTPLEQLHCLFSLDLKPDVIIYLACPDGDVIRTREQLRYDIATGNSYSAQAMAYDKQVHLLYKHNENHNESMQEFRADTSLELHRLKNLSWAKHFVKRELDIEMNILQELEYYKKELLPSIEFFILQHDPQFVIRVDGRKNSSQMFQAVKQKLDMLSFQKCSIPEPFFPLPPEHSLKVQNDEAQLKGEEKQEEGPVQEDENQEEFKYEHTFALKSPPEFVQELRKKDTVSPQFRWQLSQWQYNCPVLLFEGITIMGESQFAVRFMDKIYFLSSMGALKKFCENPRRYLMPPYPKPGCRYFIIGPKYLGKSLLSLYLSELFGAKIISYEELKETNICKKRQEHVEVCRNNALEEAIATIAEVQNQEWESAECQRKAQIQEWVEKACIILNRYVECMQLITEESLQPAGENAPDALKENIENLSNTQQNALGEIVLQLEEMGIFIGQAADFAKDLLKDQDQLLEYLPSHLQSLAKPDPPDITNPMVCNAVDEAVLEAQRDHMELSEEELIALLDKAIASVEEEVMGRTNGHVTTGGWIVEDIPLDPHLWQKLEEYRILPDHVICLIDAEPNHEYWQQQLSLSTFKLDSDLLVKIAEIRYRKHMSPSLANYSSGYYNIYSDLYVMAPTTDEMVFPTGMNILRNDEDSVQENIENPPNTENSDISVSLDDNENPPEILKTGLNEPEVQKIVSSECELSCHSNEASLPENCISHIRSKISLPSNFTTHEDSRENAKKKLENQTNELEDAIVSWIHEAWHKAVSAYHYTDFCIDYPSDKDELGSVCDVYDDGHPARSFMPSNKVQLSSSKDMQLDLWSELGKHLAPPTDNQIPDIFIQEIYQYNADWTKLKETLSNLPASLEVDIHNKTIDEIIIDVITKIEDDYRVQPEPHQSEEEEKYGEDMVEQIAQETFIGPIVGDTADYCPVALQDNYVLWHGNKSLAARYHNKVYYLSTPEAMEKFMQKPYKFAPFSKPPDTLPPPRICIIGPIGSGKTMLGRMLSRTIGLHHISVNEEIKNLTSKMGWMPMERNYKNVTNSTNEEQPEENISWKEKILRDIKNYNAEGLLSEWLVQYLVLPHWQSKEGFVLEGFPNRSEDVDLLKKYHLIPDVIINLLVSEEAVQDRTLAKHVDFWQKQQKEEKEKAEKEDNKYKIEYDRSKERRRKELLWKLKLKQKMELQEQENSEVQKLNENDISVFAEKEFTDTGFEISKDDDFNLQEMLELEDWLNQQENGAQLQEELQNVIDAEFPPLVLEHSWENEADAIHRLENTIMEWYRQDIDHIGNLRELVREINIPWEDVDTEMPLKMLVEETAKKTILYGQRSDSMLEQTYEISVDLATKLIDCGYYLLSKFGYWCPVQVAEKINPIQMYFPAKESENIHSIIYRKYIYFLVGERSTQKFKENPLKYIYTDPCSPIVPVKLAIIGPPKCGKSAVAKRLAEKFGIKVITLGGAIRHVLETMPDSELAIGIQEALCRGEVVPDHLTMMAVEAVVMEPRCVGQGFVYDGFPNKVSQVHELVKYSLLPYAVIALKSKKDYCLKNLHRETSAPFRVPFCYSDLYVEERYCSWKEGSSSCFNWMKKEYKNLIFIDAEVSKWQLGHAVEQQVLNVMQSVQNYFVNMNRGLPAAAQYLCVSSLEWEQRKTDEILHYCPVCLKENALVTSGPNPNQSGLIHYLCHLYWVCQKHMECFIRCPDNYIPLSGCCLPNDLPRRVDFNENDTRTVFADGYCVVCYKHRSLPDKYTKGCAANAVEYNKKIYQFCSEPCLHSFMKTPHEYKDIYIHFTNFNISLCHNMQEMPVKGFLEQVMCEIVSKCIAFVGAQRPKLLYTSAKTSAAVLLGLLLKVKNQKSSIDMQQQFERALIRFQNNNKAMELATKLFNSITNPHFNWMQEMADSACLIDKAPKIKSTKQTAVPESQPSVTPPSFGPCGYIYHTEVMETESESTMEFAHSCASQTLGRTLTPTKSGSGTTVNTAWLY